MNPKTVAFSMLVALSSLRAETAPMNLPRSTPEEQGIASADLVKLVDAAGSGFQSPHSIMVVRHGHVVLEAWWAPFAASEPHVLFSLSKSFTSTAVGLAQSEGLLSVDDPVLKFFPDEAPASPSDNLKAMRIRDLLRMATGQRDEDLKSFPFQSDADLVRAFLELPVPDRPGTHFVYNTAATFMLSAIVQKVSGQTVLDFLKPRLFGPLGISEPTWESSRRGGISFGGFGLSVRTEDIAKFGQLYLQRGQWGGRQLVPADWVDAATTLQIANGSDPASDWSQGYGYQFWRCRHGFYRGDGAFGQYCVVLPKYDTVVAITSGTGDMQAELNILWDKLVPALRDSALPADAQGDAQLAAHAAGLSLPVQQGVAASPEASVVSGRRYVFPENPTGVSSIAYTRGTLGRDTVALTFKGQSGSIPVGSGAWVKSDFGGEVGPVAASGAWTSGDTYSLVVWRYRTPFSMSFDLRFSGDQVILESEANVAFDGVRRLRAVGTAQP